ncbi:membrane protein [Clostridium botulinum]|nr:membrane protein [Clostridium botulinum]
MQIINKALFINIRFFMKKLPGNIFSSSIANKKIHVINI